MTSVTSRTMGLHMIRTCSKISSMFPTLRISMITIVDRMRPAG